jgi:hypothetical protein
MNYTDEGTDYVWNYWDFPICKVSIFYGTKEDA